MRRYVGLDLHKQDIVYCILDPEGQVLREGKLPCRRERILDWAEKALEATDHLAMEATTNTWAVVDLLQTLVERIVVSNPLQTKAIATAKVKTDKVDARVLADLLRCSYLPQVWQPDALTRRLRSLTGRRAGLGQDGTRLKNRIHSVLAQRLIHPPVKDLWSMPGREWLSKVELDEDGRMLIDSDLRALDLIEAERESLDKIIARVTYQLEDARLLMTLPGVGMATAMGLLAAWGDIYRFPEADKAAAYLGLAPSTRQSGNKTYHGPITKHGNTSARWLLIQAAQHVSGHPGPLGAFFRKKAKQKHRNIAVTATARKLAVIGWHVLVNREPYRYALPAPTQTKLARLRVLATGQKRKGGRPKGSSRPESYGSGVGTRTVPSLKQVYEGEGLPAPVEVDELSRGEQRVLERTQTRDVIEQTRKAQKRPRVYPKAKETEATVS